MNKLHPRQADTLRAIIDSINTLGAPPTLRGLGRQLGITSTNGVNDHLNALEKRGYITRNGDSRGIQVLKFPSGHRAALVFCTPVSPRSAVPGEEHLMPMYSPEMKLTRGPREVAHLVNPWPLEARPRGGEPTCWEITVSCLQEETAGELRERAIAYATDKDDPTRSMDVSIYAMPGLNDEQRKKLEWIALNAVQSATSEITRIAMDCTGKAHQADNG